MELNKTIEHHTNISKTHIKLHKHLDAQYINLSKLYNIYINLYEQNNADIKSYIMYKRYANLLIYILYIYIFTHTYIYIYI